MDGMQTPATASEDIGPQTHQAEESGKKQWSVKGPRTPVPGPQDDLRPETGAGDTFVRYMQGDKMPATPSVLMSNSKYLNNPYYREAYATQALRRYGRDLPPTYMVPIMQRALGETTDQKRHYELLVQERQQNPALAEWLDARRMNSYTIENTAGYAQGTLGRALYDFVSIPGMDLDFANRDKPAPASDLEYLYARRGAGHDIEHIVTGFGPNTVGELALGMVNVTADACYFTPELAQMLSAPNVWITSTSYNRYALHYHHMLPTALDGLQQGIRVGLGLKKPLFMVEWEAYLDWQLDDIAAELGFTRGPTTEWDWTTEAAMD